MIVMVVVVFLVAFTDAQPLVVLINVGQFESLSLRNTK